MYQHAKRDVHSFSAATGPSRVVKPVPVRRVKPAYYHALKRVQNAGPAHPWNSHKEEIPQASGFPDDHTSCRPPITSPSGLTRSLDGVDTRFIPPLDPLHSRCSPIPNVGALPTHDVHLWHHMQKANDEFEEFKQHLRCIKILVFRLLATSCRLVLSVIWHITAITILRVFPRATPVLVLSHNVIAWILSVLDVLLKPMPESTGASAKRSNYANSKPTASAVLPGTSATPDKPRPLRTVS